MREADWRDLLRDMLTLREKGFKAVSAQQCKEVSARLAVCLLAAATTSNVAYIASVTYMYIYEDKSDIHVQYYS